MDSKKNKPEVWNYSKISSAIDKINSQLSSTYNIENNLRNLYFAKPLDFFHTSIIPQETIDVLNVNKGLLHSLKLSEIFNSEYLNTSHQNWYREISKIKLIDTAFEKSTKWETYGKFLNDFEYFNTIEKLNSSFDITTKLLKSIKFTQYDLATLIHNYDIDEDQDIEEEINTNTNRLILVETTRIKQVIESIYLRKEELFTISPRTFEEMIAELLYQKGFDVELTKQTRDNGYDILAIRYIDGFSPIKYLVECKRYNPKKKVGVEVIRNLRDVVHTQNANKGMIVTTSSFTSGVLSETPWLLDYKDKEDIISWIDDYYKQAIIKK